MCDAYRRKTRLTRRKAQHTLRELVMTGVQNKTLAVCKAQSKLQADGMVVKENSSLVAPSPGGGSSRG